MIMIEVKNFVECLKDSDVEFFTGVPDSLLKSFCAYVTDNCR
jgi:phosphonopyruvate decarboxylase